MARLKRVDYVVDVPADIRAKVRAYAEEHGLSIEAAYVELVRRGLP